MRKLRAVCARAPPHSAAIEVMQGHSGEMHSAALGGHLCEEKALARLLERFYWPGYHNVVCEWCKLCPDCASVKTLPGKNRTPLQSVKVGPPLQIVSMDIVGPFPESKTVNSYILV